MKYIHHVSEIPNTAHTAALVDASVYIPGDERSRTHPGHGYPATTENYINYILFDNKEEMVKWVRTEEASRVRGVSPKPYLIIEVTPKVIERQVNVI